MYLRLAFWTLSIAYTSALFSRATSGASPGIMLSAAGLGAMPGFSLGGMFVRRRTRKRGCVRPAPLNRTLIVPGA